MPVALSASCCLFERHSHLLTYAPTTLDTLQAGGFPESGCAAIKNSASSAYVRMGGGGWPCAGDAGAWPRHWHMVSCRAEGQSDHRNGPLPGHPDVQRFKAPIGYSRFCSIR
jgi:hypothetical protein